MKPHHAVATGKRLLIKDEHDETIVAINWNAVVGVKDEHLERGVVHGASLKVVTGLPAGLLFNLWLAHGGGD